MKKSPTGANSVASSKWFVAVVALKQIIIVAECIQMYQFSVPVHRLKLLNEELLEPTQ